jgi:hypothetical protein
MNAFVSVTDNDWFAFLSQQPGIDEVNFWQPSGRFTIESHAIMSLKKSLSCCTLMCTVFKKLGYESI